MGHPGQHEQLQRAERAIEQNPNEQALYIRRASIYSEGGDYEKASADLQHAEKLGSPDNASFEWGLLHYRKGDFVTAGQYLDSYLRQFPASGIALEYRAKAALEAGDKQEAITYFTRNLDLLERPNPGIYIATADLFHDLNETTQALALLDNGMGKLGVIPQLQRRAIDLELEMGNTANAISRLETLRLALRENPDWKLDMAELLATEGRNKEAQKLVTEARGEVQLLRPTPARTRLLQRAAQLQTSLTRPIQ